MSKDSHYEQQIDDEEDDYYDNNDESMGSLDSKAVATILRGLADAADNWGHNELWYSRLFVQVLNLLQKLKWDFQEWSSQLEVLYKISINHQPPKNLDPTNQTRNWDIMCRNEKIPILLKWVYLQLF